MLFPKKDVILLDSVISKINLDEPLTDYTQKINALYKHIQKTDFEVSDLSELIAKINDEVEIGKIETNIKKERRRVKKKEEDLAKTARDVTKQFKEEKDDLDDKPTKQRKTQAKRKKRLVRKFKILYDDNDDESFVPKPKKKQTSNEWRITSSQRKALIDEIDLIFNSDVFSLPDPTNQAIPEELKSMSKLKIFQKKMKSMRAS
jgi:glucan-binding YG repeat protein